MDRISAGSGAFNVFGSISCMLIVKRTWTCYIIIIKLVGISSSTPSLLSMWTNKMNAIASARHEEFSGRLDAKGNKADLYGHLNAENNSR